MAANACGVFVLVVFVQGRHRAGVAGHRPLHVLGGVARLAGGRAHLNALGEGEQGPWDTALVQVGDGFLNLLFCEVVSTIVVNQWQSFANREVNAVVGIMTLGAGLLGVGSRAVMGAARAVAALTPHIGKLAMWRAMNG